MVDPETVEAGHQSAMNWTGKRRRCQTMPGKRDGRQCPPPSCHIDGEDRVIALSGAALAANQPLG
jgi:hypothetical protein